MQATHTTDPLLLRLSIHEKVFLKSVRAFQSSAVRASSKTFWELGNKEHLSFALSQNSLNWIYDFRSHALDAQEIAVSWMEELRIHKLAMYARTRAGNVAVPRAGKVTQSTRAGKVTQSYAALR